MHDAVLAEILEVDVGPRRPRSIKRGVKRKQSRYPVRRRHEKSTRVMPTVILVLR
jgi:hypothetical protein